MVSRVLTVTLNAYREAVRARVVIGLAGGGVAGGGYCLVVGAFTLNDSARVVADLGAAAISVFSIAVAILIGAQSLHRELEMKTILPLLARPVLRGEYLLGKYLGIMLVVTTFVMAEGGLVLMMSAAMGGRALSLVFGIGVGLVALLVAAAIYSPRARTFGPIPWAAAMMIAGTLLCSVAPLERSLILASSWLTLCEVAIVAAIATFFSSFSTPFLTSLLTVGMFLVGRNADALARLPTKVFGATLRQAGAALASVLPNLQVYVPARPLLTGEALQANLPIYLGWATVQALGWVVGLLVVAAAVFHRRDFL